MSSVDSKIDVKAAVAAAMNYVKNLYSGVTLRDLLLEEVEFSDRDYEWHVTIGFSLPKEEQPLLITPRQLARHYKEVRIDASTGEFKSMRIRSVT